MDFFVILPQLKTRTTKERESIRALIGRMLHFGSMGQFANIVTLINKRFSFWIINKYVGTGQLGVYSASAQLTEGLRIIGQSISIVQFARIANENDLNYAAQITVKLMKFTLFLTISALLILIIIPSDVFAWIFSEDFRGIKPVILSLAIGVIAMSQV